MTVTDTNRWMMDFEIGQVVPYISWSYFYHAWQVRPGTERDSLVNDAASMIDAMSGKFHTHAVVALYDANSDGDDILLGDGTRLPMLRQQSPGADGYCLCLSDFVRPLSTGQADRIGVFAATVDAAIETDYRHDPYERMLSQTIADRLAEATAEAMHMLVRRQYWGYAADEQIGIDDMLSGRYQGIRPAVGYPSLPDTSVNFILSALLGMSQIGITLTQSGAMRPHASVSGLMLAHPDARYFDLGKIDDTQLSDYARRRGVPKAMMAKFLSSSLLS